MEQYKVILVDDEVEVIDVMKKKIRWNDLGFDVVGSATNGVKALELVEKLQPDVVLDSQSSGERNGKLSVLEKICKELDCNFGDLIDYVPDNKEK